MKKLIIIPFVLLSYFVQAQSYVVVKPSQLPAASTINLTDLFILNQGTTTKKVTYSILNGVLKDTFATKNVFEDSIAALRSDIGTGGGVVSGAFLKAVGGSLVPYANQGEATKGALYYNAFNDIALDSSFNANTVSVAAIWGNSILGKGVTGNSVNNEAISGQSENFYGGYFQSTNSTALGVHTSNGYNHAVIGQTDSSTFPLGGGQKWYAGSVKIAEITNSGYPTFTTPDALLILSAHPESDDSYFSGEVSTYTEVNALKINDTIIGTYKNYITPYGQSYYDNNNKPIASINSSNNNYEINTIGTGKNAYYIQDTISFNFKYKTNTVAKIDSLGTIYDNKPHVALYRNTDLTISATQNIWYKITGFTTKDAHLFTVQGDSVQFQKAGSYMVNMNASFTGLNNEVWEFAVFKGATMEEPSQLRYTGTTDVGNMSCPVYISVTANQWVSFKIRNTTDNDDPTIKRFSATIIPVHLTL